MMMMMMMSARQRKGLHQTTKKLRDTMRSERCTVTLAEQSSKAPCILGRSFGCTNAERSPSVWVRGCRGRFLLGGCSGKDETSISCGWPLGALSYNCTCDGRSTASWPRAPHLHSHAHRRNMTFAPEYGVRSITTMRMMRRSPRSEEHMSNLTVSNIPLLMVVGVQKGGTSFLNVIFRQLAEICGPKGGSIEPHFWADPCFAKASAISTTRSRYFDCYFNREHSSKQCSLDKVQLMFEKSPALYTKPWAPIRIVEAFRGSAMMPKIVLLLKNPTLRAWSGFIQCFPYMKPWTRGKAFSNVSFTRELFTKLAQLEMDIVGHCSLPVGIGNFTADSANAYAFAACCEAVASGRRQLKWPGCYAYGKGFAAISICLKSSSLLGLCKEHQNRWSGGAFGDYCFDFVRQGIYVNHLPAWYSSGLDVHLILSEELFAEPDSVAQRLIQLASPNIPFKEFDTIEKRLKFIIKHTGVINSKATGGLDKMPENTRRTLSQFFKPFNEHLESRYLHRRSGWD